MSPATRREALKWAAALTAIVALDPIERLAAAPLSPAAQPSTPTEGSGSEAENVDAVGHTSNFRAIYQDPALKQAFLLFLTNVYHLYPELPFHQLIDEAVRAHPSDQQIYTQVQSQLKQIKPVLADVRFALPALAHQKDEMARETLAQLGPRPTLNGYMEIGTTGRYISRFISQVQLRGDLVLVNNIAPTYTPIDLVERGQLPKLGRFVSIHDYAPIAASDVADESLDVVANYIGFHHSPPARRDGFVRSVIRVLRPGGRLILRDHDVSSETMNRMVALAHDVFNLGLGIPWAANQREVRNFTSIETMVSYLGGFGLRPVAAHPPLFQSGDPTHNALMVFEKA
jgi:hypothetical protein